MTMAVLIILQGLIPLALVVWCWLQPAGSKTGLLLQVAASLLWMLMIALAGVWTVLPWWLPRVAAVLIVIVTITRIGNWQTLPTFPASASGRAVATFLSLVIAAIVLPIGNAISGRQLPEAPVIDLQLPFASGTFLVVNGGSDTIVNAHNRTLDESVPRYAEWRGQSYGVDFVELDFTGLRAGGAMPEAPERYFIYGTEVLAPCTGTVVKTRDGVADNRVPQVNRDEMAGNYVILRCGEFDVVLAHLLARKLSVRSGMQVQAGAIVGVVGNSGNSDEPHLHVHAQLPGTDLAPLSGEPVAMRFDGRFLVRGERVGRGR